MEIDDAAFAFLVPENVRAYAHERSRGVIGNDKADALQASKVAHVLLVSLGMIVSFLYTGLTSSEALIRKGGFGVMYIAGAIEAWMDIKGGTQSGPTQPLRFVVAGGVIGFAAVIVAHVVLALGDMLSGAASSTSGGSTA